MRVFLRGYAEAIGTEAVLQRSDALLVEELRQVVALFGRSGELAAAMSDVALPAGARRQVLEDLLSPRLSRESLRVLLRAVSEERADDLLAVLVELGEFMLALHNNAEAIRSGEEVPEVTGILGKSAWRARMAGYSAAVLEELPDASAIEAVERQISSFARVVADNAALRSALVDESIPLRVRRGVVDDLVGSRVLPATLRLLNAGIGARVRDFVAALEWLAEQAAAARGWRIAKVRSARELSGAEREALAAVLSHRVGTPVELEVAVDQSLLGGVVVAVGDLLVDASASHRLDELSELLVGKDLQVS